MDSILPVLEQHLREVLIMDRELIARGYSYNHGAIFKKRIYISIPESEKWLKNAYSHFIGDSFKWIPEYDEIAGWLSDNEERGLFLYGTYGRGKTVFIRDIFPLLAERHGKVASYYTMTSIGDNLDDVLKKKIVCLDDVGMESKIMTYGNERHAFPELMDRAEQNGNLVLVSTNLSAKGIIDRYGERTLERIKSCCKRVMFTGQSFRS